MSVRLQSKYIKYIYEGSVVFLFIMFFLSTFCFPHMNFTGQFRVLTLDTNNPPPLFLIFLNKGGVFVFFFLILVPAGGCNTAGL